MTRDEEVRLVAPYIQRVYDIVDAFVEEINKQFPEMKIRLEPYFYYTNDKYSMYPSRTPINSFSQEYISEIAKNIQNNPNRVP